MKEGDNKMKVLIAFATRYGTTEKCAGMLGDILKVKGHDVDVVDLKKNKSIDLGVYDIVAVGGSFMMFRMNSIIKRFVSRNLKKLLGMKTGVFMCGADEKWEEEIKKGFPEELLSAAAAKGYFGFEMLWDKMSGFYRNMLQKEFKTTEDVSKINLDNIKKFADELLKA
jgi:menaquinone-dependent protoporphyrinogen oxidase